MEKRRIKGGRVHYSNVGWVTLCGVSLGKEVDDLTDDLVTCKNCLRIAGAEEEKIDWKKKVDDMLNDVFDDKEDDIPINIKKFPYKRVCVLCTYYDRGCDTGMQEECFKTDRSYFSYIDPATDQEFDEWGNEIKAPPINDNVDHPKHYCNHPSGVEVITITEHMNFNLGNVIKYVMRAEHKGKLVEDLKKARFYLNREITRLGE